MGHLIVSPEKCRKIWETLKISGKHPRTTILKTCFYLSWVYYMVTVSGQCFASGWTNNDQGDRKLSEEWVCTPKSISESCWFIWPWPIDGQGNVNNPIFRQTSILINYRYHIPIRYPCITDTVGYICHYSISYYITIYLCTCVYIYIYSIYIYTYVHFGWLHFKKNTYSYIMCINSNYDNNIPLWLLIVCYMNIL